MRIRREKSVFGSPPRSVLVLTKTERRALERAAEVMAEIDEFAEEVAGLEWVEEHPARGDLVLGADAFKELAGSGELELEINWETKEWKE